MLAKVSIAIAVLFTHIFAPPWREAREVRVLDREDMIDLVSTNLDHLAHDTSGKGWDTPEANDLVLYTMMAESNLSKLRQRYSGGRIGVARGLGQIEPETAKSLIDDYIMYRGQLETNIEIFTGVDLDRASSDDDYLNDQLAGNLNFNIMLVRIRYRWAKPPIPKREAYEHDDSYFSALGEYWVKYYNAGGKATVAKFIIAARVLKAQS